jgi:hypothetical protein
MCVMRGMQRGDSMVLPASSITCCRHHSQANSHAVAPSLQGTDFTTWSEADIKVFLDERGGDFDDCTTFQQLVRFVLSVLQHSRKPPGCALPHADVWQILTPVQLTAVNFAALYSQQTGARVRLTFSSRCKGYLHARISHRCS